MNFRIVLVALLAVPTMALANPNAGDHPCEAIKKACEGAGFIKGQAKEGKGLWVDCINPIIQGKAQPEKAQIKLPTVDGSAVAACKAKHPNFGEGKKH